MAKTAGKKKPVVQADFYVGFNGATPQTNVEEPKLGEQVEYTILGTVRSVGESIRDDNETRLNIGISVEAAWPKGSKRPDNANQALMFDHDGNTTDEAAGRDASADEGDEIMAKRAEDKAAADAEWSAGYPEGQDATDYDDDGNPVH